MPAALRSTLALLVVLLGLGGYIYFVTSKKADDAEAPKEKLFKGLNVDTKEGIDEMTASASEGSGVLSATLIDGVDVMRAYQDMLYGEHKNDLSMRDKMRDSLLRYCGLDTAAMVIIWRHWAGLP